jgi:hypothetical protein
MTRGGRPASHDTPDKPKPTRQSPPQGLNGKWEHQQLFMIMDMGYGDGAFAADVANDVRNLTFPGALNSSPASACRAC